MTPIYIPDSIFFNQLKQHIKPILSHAEISSSPFQWPENRLSMSDINRQDDDHDLYQLYYKNGSYNFKLDDESLLLFEKKAEGGEGKISFIYIENPIRSDAINVSPLRYDFDRLSFELGHPISHLHIGFQKNNNQIRLGIDRLLSPISFLLLVLRLYYKENWKILINRPSFTTNWVRPNRTGSVTYLITDLALDLDVENELLLR